MPPRVDTGPNLFRPAASWGAEPAGLWHRPKDMQPARNSLHTFVRAGLAVAVIGGLLVGCSSSHHSTAGQAPTATRPATPREAAITLAHRMIEEAVLPPGARPSDAPLPALLRKPFQTPAIGNLVQAHRVWVVKGDPQTIARFLDAHRPGGLTPSGLGSESSPTGRAWLVDNEIPGLPSNVSFADLELAVADGGSGSALVRGDAVVGWTAPRPANELVGARDRVVIVSVIHTYEPGAPVVKRVVTSDPKLVQPIVRSFNSLRVAPPYATHGCPMIGTRTVSYRVEFATAATAAPDVVATIGKCGGPDVTVRGHRTPSLVGITAPVFGRDVARVLGLSEPRFG